MGFPRKGVIGESLRKLAVNVRPPSNTKKHGGEGAGKTLRHLEGKAKRVEFTGKPTGYTAKGFNQLRTKTAKPA